MNKSTPGSIGEQIDELVAHLIERNDRLASDMSHANAQIEQLYSHLKGVIAVAILFVGIVAFLFLDVGKLLW